MVGISAFLSSGDGYLGKLLEVHKACWDPFEFQGKRGLSLEMLEHKMASASVQARISSFAWSCDWKLRVPLELPVDLRDHLSFLREVRSPLSLQGTPRDSLRIAAVMNRASSRVEAGTSVSISISDFDCRVSAELEQEVRPCLVVRLEFGWPLELFTG